jgi:hypothetical protein
VGEGETEREGEKRECEKVKGKKKETQRRTTKRKNKKEERERRKNRERAREKRSCRVQKNGGKKACQTQKKRNLHKGKW